MVQAKSWNTATKLLLGASTFAFLTASAAYAQTEAQAGSGVETVIVTGTRVQGMTAEDSAQPITVVSPAALENAVASTDLTQALGTLVPSYNAQQSGADTAEFTKSAALRGLSPNDTLVLVNGMRRHYTANLHVDAGNFASGSSAPDLSLIPESAIDHVEVLTDGAAAQYGTDAISGVLNIILKDAPTGGVVSVTGGQFYDTGGATSDLTFNLGLPLPLLNDKGFVNLTVDQQTRAYTFDGGWDGRYLNATGQPVPAGTVSTLPNAQGVYACSGGNCIPTSGPYAVTNDTFYPYANRISGNGAYQLVTAEVNAGYNFNSDWQIFALGTVGVRSSKAFENVRLPTQVIATPGSNQPCSALNPQGYNTAQSATGGAACTLGAAAGTVGVAPIQGSVANGANLYTGQNARGQIISSGQAGTLFTPGELVMYPNDMEPQESIKELDYQYNAGIKGQLAGWNVNAAIGYGKDIDRISTLNTANRSLYIDTHVSPANFYDGAFLASQFTGTVDVSHNFEIGLASPLNVAGGVEAREDAYAIQAGDPSSYYKEGPQSFPGYAPSTASSHSRKNYAGYIDLAVAPIDALQLDLAGRAEHFTDFGDTQIGKLTARYDINPQWALRGTISTGFRAPTLEEEYYTAVNVSPQSATVQLAANSPAAKVLGLPNLKPETSTQFSAGVVAHPFDNFSATVDAYSITIGNRITASSTVNSSGGSINTPLVTTAVLAAGVTLDPTATMQGVTAFLNGLDTRTQGVDVMATYLTDFNDYGTVNWTLGANYNTTKITRVLPPPAILLAANPSATFFNYQTLYNYSHSAPNEKVELAGDWSLDDWGFTLRETFYGPQHSYASPNSGGELIPFNQAGVVLTDAEIRYTITDGVELSVGGNNIFNLFPDKQPNAPASCNGGGVMLIGSATCVAGPNQSNGEAQTAANGATVNQPFSGAWTANGGYYYGRITFKF